MSEPLQLVASAREQAFYEAGRQAGMLSEITRAQAIAGAAQAQIEAFVTSSSNMTTRLRKVAQTLRDFDGQSKAQRKVIQDLEYLASVSEMLRSSMWLASNEHAKSAEQAAAHRLIARSKLDQAVAQAHALTERPTFLKRLLIRALEPHT
jgi:hypothetical protein